jgi:hypothetical protein
VPSLTWPVVLTIVLLLSGALRLLAPFVAKRWPASWIDRLIAFLLQMGSNWLGALLGALLRQGTGGALVPIDNDPAAAAAMAKKAYEAYGDMVGWTTHMGAPMLSWESLPDETRLAWTVSASVVHVGAKKIGESVKRIVPVVVLGFFLAGCGQTGADLAKLTKTVSDLDPALHSAYRASREACAPAPDPVKCQTGVDAVWKPIEDAMTEIHTLWCSISPTSEGCGK